MIKIFLIILLLLISGCSSNNAQASKLDSTANQQASAESILKQPMAATTNLEFPISDDPLQLSNIQSIGYSYLGKAITSYYKAKGLNEATPKAIIDNGYLLFWPRNVVTGEPVSTTNEKFSDPNSTLFGKLSYQKLNDNFVEITRVTYRPDSTGDWKFISGKYPGKGDMESADIVGCPVNLTTIADPDTKYLLAMFGQLTNFLISGTGYYNSRFNTLPTSFSALLGPEMLIIRENYQNFTDLVARSNVVFKWGIDQNKMCNYVFLSIDGVTYIEHCIDHSAGSSMDSLETMLACDYKKLDTSSPILTEKNLANVVIPDEYYVARDNIVSAYNK